MKSNEYISKLLNENEFIVHYILKNISDYPTMGKTKIAVKVNAESSQIARNLADKRINQKYPGKFRFDNIVKGETI